MLAQVPLDHLDDLALAGGQLHVGHGGSVLVFDGKVKHPFGAHPFVPALDGEHPFVPR